MNEGRRPENCQHLGSDGIAALERLLAQPFTLNFRIGAALSDAGDTFRALEPTQYHILDSIADIPRALIRGGAGTGKTVVAIEEAIRSAAAGRRTLLTCHSRPLAANLERQLRDIKNLTVIGFHSLCGRMAKEGQVPVPSGVSERELYETVLPEILYHAMGAVPSARWDTVIVDEAQDFRTDWWLAIEACIKPDGRLRVFMDSNQVVYDEAGVTAQDLTAVPVRLSRNLRNTKPIHRAAAVHYMGPEIVPDGPDGLEVIWIEAENEPEKTSAAYKELRRLIFDEEVDPGDIAVLLNGPSGRLAFLEKCAGTSIPVTDAQDVTREEVVVDTVRRFKGLERPAVIVVVTGDEMPRPELAYVAFSRAKAFLAVVSSTGELALLRGQDASTDHRVSN
jgi:superfamily I DNA and RNA helicase